jgi:hypothetical protein
MENKPTQRSDRLPLNDQLLTATPAAAPESMSHGIKVIQPLSSSLAPATMTPPSPPPAPLAPIPGPVSVVSPSVAPASDLPFNPPASHPDMSSIYPQPNYGLEAPPNNYQRTDPRQPKDEKYELLGYDSGSAVGASIFWQQFLAGIVLSLLLYGIARSGLLDSHIGLFGGILLGYRLFEIVVLAYIPYAILKAKNVADPVWLTLFGAAMQLSFVGILFLITDQLILHTLLSRVLTASIAHGSSGGYLALAGIINIATFVASYFLTKRAWGYAFVWFDKMKNKIGVRVIAVAIIALLVAGLAYHYLAAETTSAVTRTRQTTINTQ